MLLFFLRPTRRGTDGTTIRWFFLTFSKKNDKQKYLISLFYSGEAAFFSYLFAIKRNFSVFSALCTHEFFREEKYGNY